MLIRNNLTDLVGLGVYTPAEASRLTKVPTARVHRWLEGRRRVYDGEDVVDPPLWTSRLPQIDGRLYLSFRDLVELRVVDRFRRMRISLPYLRRVVTAARDILGDTHPFSNARLKTDGRSVYVEILSAIHEPELIEVLSGQHAFHSIISEGLRDIDFEGEAASSWHPAEGRGNVVLDPRRAFGAPILAMSGVPTATMRLQADAGRTVKQIARDFELDGPSVRAALSFETSLAA